MATPDVVHLRQLRVYFADKTCDWMRKFLAPVSQKCPGMAKETHKVLVTLCALMVKHNHLPDPLATKSGKSQAKAKKKIDRPRPLKSKPCFSGPESSSSDEEECRPIVRPTPTMPRSPLVFPTGSASFGGTLKQTRQIVELQNWKLTLGPKYYVNPDGSSYCPWPADAQTRRLKN